MSNYKVRVETERNVYEETLDRIRHLYDKYDEVAVSFSGGKDSTVVLNLTIQVARELGRLPVRTLFFDEEAIYTEVTDYVARVAQNKDVNLEWYCVPIKHRNSGSNDEPVWYPWAPEDEHKWCRPLPQNAITEIPPLDPTNPDHRFSIPDMIGLLAPPAKGNTVFLLGIRTQESLMRLRAVTRRAIDNYIIKHEGGFADSAGVLGSGNVWKAYPIYDWKLEDVWTAPKMFNWDYCKLYDYFDKAGLSPHAQRVAPPFGEQPLQNLYLYQQIDPAMWDKMSKRVPGARTAARYSRTSLYGMGKMPDKPTHMTYPEWIRSLVAKHDLDVQKKVAKAIEGRIKRHYSKTKDPILFKSGHPVTALSWKFLAKLAIRADTKGRMVEQVHDGSEASIAKAWRNYNAERAETEKL